MIESFAAISIGLMGSFHCIGMCGPIVLALPLPGKNWILKITGSLLYNLGRAVTYAIMGLILGLFGKGLTLAGFQQTASIVLGCIMILSVFFPVLLRKANLFGRIYTTSNKFISKYFGKLFKIRSLPSLFFIGLLNGLLPCGLVYIALAGAIASGSPVTGAYFMFLFGLGTLPLLLIFSLMTNAVSFSMRNKIRKVVPVFIIVLGILFILRGSNLGIKYISPKLNKNNTEIEHCCH